MAVRVTYVLRFVRYFSFRRLTKLNCILCTDLSKNVLLAAIVALATGCTAGTNAILQTVENVAFRSSTDVEKTALNPNFQYLRLTIDGRMALLALGDVDSNSRGQVEVWYSAQREVLRFQDGRLVGAVGLTTEWRSVDSADVPSWSSLKESQQPRMWTRIRDVMPRYRFGIRDRLVVLSGQPPIASALSGIDPASLTWFEERMEPGDGAQQIRLMDLGNPDDALPPARYAVDYSGVNPVVIYGEQCLKPTFCFTWQRWPVSGRGR
jgi:hypothetical protein